MIIGGKMKEKVLNFLNTQYDALDIMAINDALGLTTPDELAELITTLNELVSDLVVYETKKKKYILYSKCPNFKTGIIDVNKKGFGFLLQEDGPDIHIAPKELNYALDGDTVLVEVLGSNLESPEGKVLKVIKRDVKNVVGMINMIDNKLVFVPKDKCHIELIIDPDSLKKCVDGEIVVASITKDLGKNRYEATITRHIAHKNDASKDILMVAATYDIYPDFPEEAMTQAEAMPTEVLRKDYQGRVDLTDEMIFTIDSYDTHDIDDAVSLKYEKGLYHLGVHIADVSYYVTENSPLDVEALTRGTSSYLAGSVIPQLPHKLSNGICSLNPSEPRCAISLIMDINSSGKVTDYNIFPSIIKSNKKMTYTAVNNILSNDIIEPGYERFAENLKLMNELAHIIRAERVMRGASDFDIPEAKIICDEQGVARDISVRERGEGERLIEDFMIVANETVARIFTDMDLPGIYRVHDIPKPEKIQKFITFCSSLGLTIKGHVEKITPKSFQKMLDQIKAPDYALNIIKSLAVRSMPKAYYSPVTIGHFGLASRNYLHFTSPIRRYPDLQTHRLLHKFIFEHQLDEETIHHYENILEGVARQSSEREVAAVEAERAVDKMKMAEYMEQHVGQSYKGVISGVTGFGLFVQLIDNLVEGLVSITTIPGDYFEYVEDLEALIGKHHKIMYRMGDLIQVKCVRASKEDNQIDFEIIKEKEKHEVGEETHGRNKK